MAKKKKKKITIEGLRKFNIFMFFFFALQAGILFLLASQKVKFPITTNYLTFDRATESLVSSSKTLFDLPLVWPIIAFVLICMLSHLLISTIWYRGYKKDLKSGMNRARWIEYSVSASLMIVAISLLTGIYDLASLIMLFALVMVMNLCGLIMEIHNQTTEKTNWISYIVGCIAGIVPWAVIAIYFWASASSATGGAQIPAFVYWIFITIFIFFNCFAINMFLQYKKWGPWSNYLYGERVYIILSLVAKTALIWQVFAGTLRP
jgi:hypothetical protein